jgi:hypothetical protein
MNLRNNITIFGIDQINFLHIYYIIVNLNNYNTTKHI